MTEPYNPTEMDTRGLPPEALVPPEGWGTPEGAFGGWIVTQEVMEKALKTIKNHENETIPTVMDAYAAIQAVMTNNGVCRDFASLGKETESEFDSEAIILMQAELDPPGKHSLYAQNMIARMFPKKYERYADPMENRYRMNDRIAKIEAAQKAAAKSA